MLCRSSSLKFFALRLCSFLFYMKPFIPYSLASSMYSMMKLNFARALKMS
jgi:hypothetical protein